MSPLELGLVLSSALLHALWNACAKSNPNPNAFLAFLAIGTVVSGVPLFWFIDFALIPPDVWKLVAATAVVHALYQIFLARAYETGDLTVVYPISRSTPAFVALIAVPLLDDPVSLVGAAGILLVLVGMWLVHTGGRISSRAFRAPGIFFAYLTLATTVGYSLIDKMAMVRLVGWSGVVPGAVLYFYLLSFSNAGMFVAYTARRLPRAAWGEVLRAAWGKLIVAVFSSVLSYVFILEALRTASVSYVTAVRQMSVVFAAALGMSFLRERPERAQIIGASMTVFGVVLIALFP